MRGNPARFLAISEDARPGYRKWPDNPEPVKSSQQSAPRARDDGLRRVRKITWRIGLFAAAAAAFVGARFAHLSPSLPSVAHLPSGSTGGSGTGSGTSSGRSSSSSQGSSSQGSSSQGSSSQGSSVSGISSSSGVSSAGSGGQVTSGGS